MAISTEEKYLLNNKAGRVANKVQLGTLIQNAESGGLAAGAVGTTELAALAVTTAKIAADAVDNTKLADASVSTEQLDSGITFTHRVVAAGKFTTAGGDANEQITAAAVVATDVVLVSLQDQGGTPRTILTAKAGTGVIDLVFSGDPSTDHVVCYTALRAAT